ncbi:fimbrial protein [Providencia stuartii]|uniref:fimbrial protein n=1 Tax=Providencia stuartii TaxID=588 RepID=UPI0018C7E4ED|nr:fimbrial protein [Providencia stuartii]MBG5919090.1 fimbrial protein [Providencia stuartii]
MFKKTLCALSLISVSCAALSAPVANLKVTGSVTPPTCTINNQNEIDVEYKFDVAPQMFPVSGALVLTPESKRIEIVCDATTYLSFDATDNRSDSVMTAGNGNFGLGKFGTDNDKNIGFYTIAMKNATTKANADATENKVGVLVGTTYNATGLSVVKNSKASWGISPQVPASAQIFAADFEVKPTLNAELKSYAGDVSLDGHTTLSFGFSI